MYKKVKVQLKIKGQSILLSINENQTIQQILKTIKNKKSNLLNDSFSFQHIHQHIHILNGYNYDQLDKNQDISSIVCNTQTKIRQILIKNKFGNIKIIDDEIKYDSNSQIIFKQVCQYILNNNDQKIKELYKLKNISGQLYQLICMIMDKIRAHKKSQILLQRKQIDFAKKISQNQKKYKNTFDQIQKQCALKLIAKDRQFTSKLKDKDLQLTSKLKDKDIQAQQLIKNIKKQHNENLQNLQKQKQQLKNENSQLLQSVTSMIQSSIKNQLSLLYKSKTFQRQNLKSKINQYGKILHKFINSYCQNNVLQIRSQFYMGKDKPVLFLDRLKEKQNFIILFSCGQKVFGIFSPLPISKQYLKSGYGFLFNLQKAQMFELIQKQNLWKQSNVELKIGNDCLTMSQYKGSQNNFKLNYKKKLNSSFKIDQDDMRYICGEVNGNINIDSFELLTVVFQKENEKFKKLQEQNTKSRRLKTQSDRY